MFAENRVLFSVTLSFVFFVGSTVSIECYEGTPFLDNYYGVKVTNCGESECYLSSIGGLHAMKCGYGSDCRMAQYLNNMNLNIKSMDIKCCNESLCNAPESLRDMLERRLVRTTTTTTTESTLLSDVQAIDSQIEQSNFHVEPPKSGGLWNSIWRFMNQAFDDVTIVYGRSPNRPPTYLSNWYYGRTGGGISHSKNLHKPQSSNDWTRSGSSSSGWSNNHYRGSSSARTSSHSKSSSGSSGSWWSSSSSRSSGRSSSSRGSSRSRGGG